jgi:hypothetical protein
MPEPLAWAELFAIISTDDSLLAASPGEDLVFFGVFPKERDWYLRFYTPEIDDLPGSEYLTRHGRFDLTGPPALVKPITEEIAGTGLRLRTVPGVGYFDRAI